MCLQQELRRLQAGRPPLNVLARKKANAGRGLLMLAAKEHLPTQADAQLDEPSIGRVVKSRTMAMQPLKSWPD